MLARRDLLGEYLTSAKPGRAMSDNINADSLDVRQLKMLQMLLAERSVSRAAAILRQSQPSVSAHLKRLREIFRDPLLVRSGQIMVLTERAEKIRLMVDQLLDDMHRLLDADELFDSGRARRQIRIAAANCFEVFFVPRLTQAIRMEAPHATVEFTPHSMQSDLSHDLETGHLDAVIGNWPVPPQNLRHMALIKSDIACIMCETHAAAQQKAISLEQYLTLNHVSPTARRQFSVSPIDANLAAMQLSRRVVVSVPEYGLVKQVLPGSDLVFTTGRPYAEYMARHGDFRILDAPPELGSMTFYLLWHERSQFSKYHHWLRTIVRRVAKSSDLFLPQNPSPVALMKKPAPIAPVSIDVTDPGRPAI
jgi:DNA-binding transcriptional LysR family regulator